MAETYPLALPTHTGIAQIRLLARDVVGVSTSPFNLKQRVFRHPGQRWEADITLPPMKREDAEQWATFLLRLRGQYGTFLLGDPSASTPRGSAATAPGTPRVNGADQTGDELDIDGIPTSGGDYLKAGDYIQLGSGATATLHKVLEDVSIDGSGEATLNLWPKVRTAPADDASITVSGAQGVFRLAANEVNWDINQATVFGITFGAVEALS